MPVLKNAKHELSDLQALLSLNGETWRFTWLRNVGRARSCQIAGTVQNNGYRVIRVGRRCYLEHHLVWLFTYGVWPTLIDHENGNRQDNSPLNLREADTSQNIANSKRYGTNTSGFKGVSRASNGKWRAYITKDYK